MSLRRTEIREKSEGYHGSASFESTSPAFTQDSLNVALTFDEALKLHLAVLDAVMDFNRLNRNTEEAKALRVVLSIKRANNRIQVITR
jgi:hypothetical protein